MRYQKAGNQHKYTEKEENLHWNDLLAKPHESHVIPNGPQKDNSNYNTMIKE